METVLSSGGVEVFYKCTVQLLNEGKTLECVYKSNDVGRILLDHVCKKLQLPEKQYWGLTFKDMFGRKQWLRMEELIRPQLKELCPVLLHFQLKFYPTDPHKIMNEETRDQILLQLHNDLLQKPAVCNADEIAMLIALNLQNICGDYNPAVHTGHYVTAKVVKDQKMSAELSAIEMHKSHLMGLNKSQTEDLFLRMTSQLETYGMDLYTVKDDNGTELHLGFNRKGILTFLNHIKILNLPWSLIETITNKDNQLFIHLKSNEVVMFFCSTKEECKYIFFRGIEQQVLFAVPCEEESGSSDDQTNFSRKHFEEIEDPMMNTETTKCMSDDSPLDCCNKEERTKKYAHKVYRMRKYVMVILLLICIILYGVVHFSSEIFNRKWYSEEPSPLVVVRQHLDRIIEKYWTNKLYLLW